MSRYIDTSVNTRFMHKFSRSSMLNRLKMYGFIECGNIITFLNYVCDDEMLGVPALRYIYSKITECLKNHATDVRRFGSADSMCYFQDLRALKEELEFVISLSHD